LDVAHGYTFEMTASLSRTHWAAVASPAEARRWLAQLALNIVDYVVDNPRASFFYIDETGILRQDPCPPGFKPVVINGKLRCEPPAIQMESTLGAGTGTVDQVIASLKDLSQAFPGALSEAKKKLTDPSFVETVKTRFDADGDGRLAFAELLDPDLLEITRSIVVRPPVDPPIGDDAALRGQLAELQSGLTKALAFTDDEDLSVPAVQLDHIQILSTPTSLLELVSEDPRDAAISVLQAAIGELNVAPTPNDGDMADPDQSVNARRKGRLMETAEGLTNLLRFGRLAALRNDLRRLRTQATEWLVPGAARRIVSLVDRALAVVE
jgi:hypothetical protein